MSDRFANVKVTELKVFCRLLKLPLKGAKKDLVERLERATPLDIKELRARVDDEAQSAAAAGASAAEPPSDAAAESAEKTPVPSAASAQKKAARKRTTTAPDDALMNPVVASHGTPNTASGVGSVNPVMASHGTPNSARDDAKKRVVVKTSSRRGIMVDDDDDTLDWSYGRYILFNLGDGAGMRVGQFDVQFSAKDKLKVTLCVAVKTGQIRRSNQVSWIPREEIQYGPFNLVGRSLPPEVLQLTQFQQLTHPGTPAMSTTSVTPVGSPRNATPAASSSNVTPVASPRSATPKAHSAKANRNAKSRAQPASETYAEPFAQPLAQTTAEPCIQSPTVTMPAAQASAKTSGKPLRRLAEQRAAQSIVESPAKFSAKPPAKRTARLSLKSSPKPSATSAAQRAEQPPAVKSSPKRAVKPVPHSSVNPVAQPSVQPASQPSAQSAALPIGQSSTQSAASRCTGKLFARPSATQVEPARSCVPSAQPSARPVVESSTEPHAQPSVPRVAGVSSTGVPPVRQRNAATVPRVKDEVDESARLRPGIVHESAQRPIHIAKAVYHPTAPSNLKMFLPVSSFNKNARSHTAMSPTARLVAPPVIGATSSHQGGTNTREKAAIPPTIVPSVASTGPPLVSSASLNRSNSTQQLAAKPVTHTKDIAHGSTFKDVTVKSPRTASPVPKKPRVVQNGAVVTRAAEQQEAASQKIECSPLQAAVKHVKQVGSRMLAMIPGNPMSPQPTKGRRAMMEARIIQFSDDEIKRVANASGSSADEPSKNTGPLYYDLDLNFTKRPEDQYEISSCPSDSDKEIDRSHKYVPGWCKTVNETCARNQQHNWDADWIFGNNVVDIKEEDISRAALNRKQRPSVAFYNFEKHQRRLVFDPNDDARKLARRKLRICQNGWVLKNPQDL